MPLPEWFPPLASPCYHCGRPTPPLVFVQQRLVCQACIPVLLEKIQAERARMAEEAKKRADRQAAAERVTGLVSVRPAGGSFYTLADAMSMVFECQSLAELQSRTQWPIVEHEPYPSPSKCGDRRNGWQTWLVCVKLSDEYPCAAKWFTNGPFPDSVSFFQDGGDALRPSKD